MSEISEIILNEKRFEETVIRQRDNYIGLYKDKLESLLITAFHDTKLQYIAGTNIIGKVLTRFNRSNKHQDNIYPFIYEFRVNAFNGYDYIPINFPNKLELMSDEEIIAHLQQKFYSLYI